ncbi:MAG: PAS domain S-box protein, partial [Planctomycetes bacterium]|nr:PAS domain S-box protein [Planctomycetota bacterium]
EMLVNALIRKQAQAALQESEERYRLNFENVSDVIYSVNSGFEITEISPSVERLLGYKREELMGKPFTELNILTQESLDRAFADTINVFEGEPVNSAIYEFIAKDGSIKMGEASGAPLFKDGKVVATVAVARDITERMQSEKALKDSEEKYRLIADNTSDFISVTDINGA